MSSFAWLVTPERFLLEYQNHIADQALKFINWFVEPDNSAVNMYITATNGTDIFCYRHEGDIASLPATFKELLRVNIKGMVLGTKDIITEQKMQGLTEGINELNKKLQLGVLNDK